MSDRPQYPPVGQPSGVGYPSAPTGAGYPSAPPTGAGYPPAPGAARPTARPPVLYVVLGLIVLGSLLTIVDWYLDRRVLTAMFWASDEMAEILPTFNTARLVASVLGVVVALGLLGATFLGANWARILLAVTCFGYAVVNLGAGLAAAFTLVAGRGAFNEGGDTTTTGTSVLNGLSLAIDALLLLMVVVSAVILLTGRTRAYTRAGTGTR